MSKDLLLEIGTEEIPAHVMPHLLSDLKRLAGEQLRDQRLSYENLRTIGTPRRDGTCRAAGRCQYGDARALGRHRL